MNRVFHFKLDDILPTREAVLRSQGISKNSVIPTRITRLLNTARDLFLAAAEPVGMVSDLSVEDFEAVFKGEAQNEKDAPLGHIFPRANQLALFALTMGGKVSSRIEDLFENNEFAPGSMLDTVASLAADLAVEICEKSFFDELSTKSIDKAAICVQSYCPGYCGWHISGQKNLFQHLRPDKIGISLNNSFLMSPLKSVSGVLVAGGKEIHLFENNYSFCRLCKSQTCRQRMKKIS